MKRFSSVIAQAICVILIAIGGLAGLITTSLIAALFIAWHHEGRLLAEDWRIFWAAAKSLAVACAVTSFAFWIRKRLIAGEGRDDSFKLVRSASREQERLAQEISQSGLFALLAVCLWTVTSGNVLMRIGTVTGLLTIAFLTLHLRILIHELGHLGAARMLNYQLYKMQVGAGPVLLSYSFAKYLHFEWRVWPHCGFVLAGNPRREHSRLRRSFFISAGPISDILFLWIAYKAIELFYGGFPAVFEHGAGGLLIGVLFSWFVLGALSALIPHKTWLGNRKISSDGYLLFRLWTAPKDQIAELMMNPDATEALAMLRTTSSEEAKSLTTSESIVPKEGANIDAFRQQQTRLGSRLLPKSELC